MSSAGAAAGRIPCGSAMPPARSIGWRWSDATWILLLAISAVLPYLNILFNSFVYDDNTQVLNNPYLQSFRHLREIFTTSVWSYIGAQGVTNYFRPMMTFGYLLCYQMFGPLAYGFHLASIVLHAGATCLLFLVTRQLFQDHRLAFVAGLLFALHPIHTESVAWIAAVTDVELTVFYLLTFWAFLGVARPDGGRSDSAQLMMVGSFVLALLSKEQALTLPVLATAYEHFYREDRARTTWSAKAGRYGFLWLIALAYIAFRIRFLGALAPVAQIPDLARAEAIYSAVALVGQYLGKLLFPVDLCAFYVFHRSTSLADPRVVAGLVGLVLSGALFFLLWRKAHVASFTLVWIFVTLAPVLNPRWMAANVFTERYLYLPSAGFCCLVAWGWVRLWERFSARPKKWRRALAAALAIVAGLYAVRVVTRNRDWRDDVVLYTRTLVQSPDAYHIRNNLGTVYWKQGKVEAAEREWLTAHRLAPRNAIILNNLGLVRAKEKRYEEAVEYFRRAMHLQPNYTDPHLNLGEVLAAMGRKEEAKLQLRAAVALSPLNVSARNLLGKLYLDAGSFAEAEEQFRRSVQSKPTSDGYYGLGLLHVRRQEYGQAEEAFRQAAWLDRFDSRVRFRLGTIYKSSGRTAEALREFQAGLETDPSNPEALAALEELGRRQQDETRTKD